jgi:hypothetical protein
LQGAFSKIKTFGFKAKGHLWNFFKGKSLYFAKLPKIAKKSKKQAKINKINHLA